MRYIFIIAGILLSACGGSISEKQRESLQEELANREIKKIKEEEVVSKTYEVGQAIYQELLTHKDSLANHYRANIYNLKVDSAVDNKIDYELLKAYEYSANNGTILPDNVQRDGEVMVYSIPLIENEMFKGVRIIRVPRKYIIREL